MVLKLTSIVVARIAEPAKRDRHAEAISIVRKIRCVMKAPAAMRSSRTQAQPALTASRMVLKPILIVAVRIANHVKVALRVVAKQIVWPVYCAQREYVCRLYVATAWSILAKHVMPETQTLMASLMCVARIALWLPAATVSEIQERRATTETRRMETVVLQTAIALPTGSHATATHLTCAWQHAVMAWLRPARSAMTEMTSQLTVARRVPWLTATAAPLSTPACAPPVAAMES